MEGLRSTGLPRLVFNGFPIAGQDIIDYRLLVPDLLVDQAKV